MANEFKIRKGLIVTGASGGTVVDIQGSQGQLFSVTDDLSGSIFAVSDISGVPIFDVNSSGLSTFDGLVSGITPVNAANFVTKAYVDGSGGGTGPFLPLAGGTLTGALTGTSATFAGNLNVNGNATLGDATTDDHVFNGQVTQVTGDALGYKLLRSNGATSMLISATSDAEIEFGTDNGSGTNTTQWTIGKDGTDNSFRISNSASLGTSDTLTLTGANATFAGNVTTESLFQVYSTGVTAVVGAIGNTANDVNIYSTTAGHNGLRMHVNGILPTNNAGTIIDNDADLGDPGYRFKDLYLGGSATATTFLGDLNGTINTVTTATTQVNAIDNDTVATTAYVNNKIALIPAGLRFEGTWDASTGNPPSSSPENGQFWIVSVAGSTNLDGITDWKVGDWAIYVEAGTGTDGWQKVDNSSVLDGSGTGQSVTKWDGSGTSNTLTNGPITFSGNNSTFAGSVGIGVTPTVPLDISAVEGTIKLTSSTGTNFTSVRTVNTGGTLYQGIERSTGGVLGLTGAYEAFLFYGADNPLLIGTANSYVRFATNSTERMRIDSSGNVGIGSSASIAGRVDIKMDMVGESFVPDGTSAQWAKVWASGGTIGNYFNDAMLHINTNRSGGATGGAVGIAFSPGWINHQNWGIYSLNTTGSTYTSGDLAFVSQLNSGTIIERVRFNGVTGNVGIGTDSPAKKLTVATNAVNDGVYITTSGGTNVARIGTSSTATSGVLSLLAGGSTKVFISAKANENSYFNGGGNVGIGVTGPATKLQVVGATGEVVRISAADTTTGAINTGAYISIGGHDGVNPRTFGYVGAFKENGTSGNYSGYLSLATRASGGSSTEKLRISSAGAIKFNAYNSANNTGTPIFLLGTDNSGNVVKTLSSTAPGSLWLATGNDIYNTNSANVGIGTTSPSSFNSRGRNLVVNSNGDTGITISANTTSSSTLLFADAFAGTGGTAAYRGAIEYDHADDSMAFSTSATETMRIKSNGDVQARRYTNDAPGEVALSLQPLGSTKHYGWRIDSATGSLNLDRADSNDCLVTYDDSGNVGIGTTLPTNKLHVYSGNLDVSGSNAGTGNKILLTTDQNAHYIQANGYWVDVIGNQAEVFRVFGGTGGTSEYLRVTGSGNVGIGMTSPANKIQTEYSPVAIGSLTATDNSSSTTNFNVNAGLLIQDSNGSNGLALGVSGQANDRKSWIQSGHPGAQYGANLGTLSLNPLGGNVGIGTTSPTEKFEVRGGVVRISNASNDSGTLAFGNYLNLTGYYDNGIFRSALNNIASSGNTLHMGSYQALAFTTSAAALGSQTLRMYIPGAGTGAGNVGIGTTNPVDGNLQVTKTGMSTGITNVLMNASFADGSNGTGLNIGYRTDETTAVLAPRTATGNLAFYNYDGGWSESMRITSTGNVGIGTSTPLAKLDIQGTQGQLFSVTDDLSGSIFAVADISGVPIFDVNSSGKVGINTTSANDIFDVRSPSWATRIQSTVDGTYLRMSPNQIATFTSANAGSPLYFNASSTGNILMVTGGGRVGIGTTNPSKKLQVVSSAFFGPDGSTSRSTNAVGINYTNTDTFSANQDLTDTNRLLALTNDATSSNTYAPLSFRVNPGGGTANAMADIKLVANGSNHHLTTTIRNPATNSFIDTISIAQDGNVGIGTIDPQYKLQVEGDMLVANDINLSSRARIVLDDEPFADPSAGSGTIVKWSVSSTTTAGLLYMLKFNGGWTAADADFELKSTGMVAISLGSNATAGMLLQGFFYKSAHGFTIGLPLYISNTEGAFTNTRPTGSNDYVRVIGYATSANHIYFDPDKTWVQVV